ncbi:hypothetical protein KM043_012809 [Ampulex compressa]|nr:hypothetical protein KM043_012809 [Ampulex compressa]
MVLTVTEDTPADMLAGSMELLVQLPRDHNLHTQRVTVQRSTPMIDLLVQIATAHKLAASSYTLQAIGERGLVLPHQPNTPIGALDALQVKLLPKQGTFVPRKAKQVNQPFETTFRLQVHLPRNQLYVSRVSPKMNLGDILTEVCREKNLDRNKYELRHPANLEETLDLSLSLQDYHLQEVTLYAKQGRTLSSALSSQDIMALQRQEERRRQQAKQSVFGFMFKKSKESSLSTDSLGGRSASPARSDETGRSASPLQPPARPQRKRRPAPKPPVPEENGSKEKMIISHSRNSSDSSGYHEASVLSDNPESAGRLPETLPRRSRAPGASEAPRKLAHTSHSSKSLGNLAAASGTLGHGISNTSLSSAGLRKKRAAPPPPVPRPLSSAISTQALERIVDSEESLTSDMDPSKPPSDIGAPSKVSSDIEERPKANSDIGVTTMSAKASQDMKSFKANSDVATTSKSDLAKNLKSSAKLEAEVRAKEDARSLRTFARSSNLDNTTPVDENPKVENARVAAAKRGKLARSYGSIENDAPSYSFVSRNSLEHTLEMEEDADYLGIKKRPSLFGTEKQKLQARIEEQRLRVSSSFSRSNSESTPRSQNSDRRSETKRTVAKNKSNYRDSKSQLSVQRSRSLAHSDVEKGTEGKLKTVRVQSRQKLSAVHGSLNDGYYFKPSNSPDKASRSKLIRMETLAHLDGIETDIESMPECGVLESRFSPRKHADNYICNEKCHDRLLKHSLSFQNNFALKETRIVNSFEKLSNSQSFCVKGNCSRSRDKRLASAKVPKLGDICTTECHADLIVSSRNKDRFGALDYEDCDGRINTSPPPLSKLQIFAISTKPLDIQVAPIESIPNNIDKLPSFPIIQHAENKLELDKKLSILEPPPPGLVSRQESNENWNQFLVQLNSILESRAGEFV